MKIPDNERGVLHLNVADDVGAVFSWRGRVYRAVSPQRADETRTLLASGLLADLSAQRLVPATGLSSFETAEAAFLLESRQLAPVVLPHEWSFSMLRAAALAVSRVGDRARDYGFNLKDCHPANVVFDGLQPSYVDIGSFMPDRYVGWRPFAQFLERYYYPLALWPILPRAARLSLLHGDGLLHREFFRTRPYWPAGLPAPLERRLIGLAVQSALAEQTRRRDQRDSARERLQRLLRRGLTRVLPLPGLERRRILRAIARMPPPPDNLSAAPGLDTAALQRALAGLHSSIGHKPTLHIVGAVAASALTELIQQQTATSLLCSDPADAAIDRLFRQLRQVPQVQQALTLAVCDPLEALDRSSVMPTHERLRHDVVLVTVPALQRYLQRAYRSEPLLQRFRQFARTAVLLDCGDDVLLCRSFADAPAQTDGPAVALFSRHTASVLTAHP